MTREEYLKLQNDVLNYEEDIRIGNMLEELMSNNLFQDLVLDTFCKSFIISNIITYTKTKDSTNLDYAKSGSILLSWFQQIKERKELAERYLPEARNDLIRAVVEE